MGVLLIINCLCYPDCALFVTYLLLGDSFLSKIILIVSSITQCFYQLCMFITRIPNDIVK